MYEIAAISVVFFLIWRVFKHLGRGIKRTLEQLQRCIEDLYSRGFDGGVLTIENQSGNKFIQLLKYESLKSKGIVLSFPKKKWSEAYYSGLVEHLDRKSIAYKIEQGSDKTEFVSVDFGSDIEKARELVEVILLDIFKETSKSRYYVLLENARLE